ncbi:TlpA family protein disulfide reductase [Phenylobacterium sp.]|jgi:thiol-disulfide isomerase/thioredoxin|uniref:TlpA family protein disulfide reductase n=1 Tax=Phenylobacterium sp. TaxID=1871053 RepID=UPI0037830692
MNDQSAAKPSGGILKWALWGAALFGVAAVLYIIAQSGFKPREAETPAPAVRTVMEKLVVPKTPLPPPPNVFVDAQGKEVRLTDFKGKVVVMNAWATWCAPCKVEMPTLAKLQAAYAGKPVEVVAISIDSELAVEDAREFIAENAPLKFYHDPAMKLPFALKPAAAGMPTTVIYGPDGLERGRVSGEADWSSPAARAVIDGVLAEG